MMDPTDASSQPQRRRPAREQGCCASKQKRPIVASSSAKKSGHGTLRLEPAHSVGGAQQHDEQRGGGELLVPTMTPNMKRLWNSVENNAVLSGSECEDSDEYHSADEHFLPCATARADSYTREVCPVSGVPGIRYVPASDGVDGVKTGTVGATSGGDSEAASSTSAQPSEYRGFSFVGPVPPSVSATTDSKPFGSVEHEWPLLADMQQRMGTDGERMRRITRYLLFVL